MQILLIQLKRIGDLILTTPAVAAVREKFPDARLTIVISSEGKALAPAITGINKILVMRRGFGGFRTVAAIARQKFDYCIDFTRNDRSALLCFSRARKSGSCRFESKSARDFEHVSTTNLSSIGCETCT